MDVPAHIGIIMDGNRRWAKQRGLSTIDGHRAGFDALRATAEHALDLGVKEMSVFAFSTENWKRSAEEVKGLMDLFRWVLKSQIKQLHDKNVKVRIVGSREGVDEDLCHGFDEAEALTAANTRGTLNVLFNYGGRRDLVEAAAKIVSSGLAAQDITEETVSQTLATNGMRDVDLLIRTTEYRLSGFLPWESVYAEIYFQPDVFWPDFDASELERAIDFYQQRQRRFGA